MSHLDVAVDEARQALTATSTDGPSETGRLVRLSASLCQRYLRKRATSDLEEAFEVAAHAIDASLDDPNRAFALQNLSNIFNSKYIFTRDQEDLDKAIEYARQAVSAAHDDPEQGEYLYSLATHLDRNYKNSGNIAILSEGIEAAERATESILDDEGRALVSDTLAALYKERYFRTKQKADLEKYVCTARQALAAAPDDADRPFYMYRVSKALNQRHLATLADADIEEAIQMVKACLETDSDTEYHYMYWDQLATCLAQRYTQKGGLTDLDEAIRLVKQAINACPFPQDKAEYMNHLGGHLSKRYLFGGNMSDLDAAIQTARQSVAQTPSHHMDKPQRINNLALYLAERYLRTRAMEDLEAAIRLGRKALELAPADHPIGMAIMNNLGIWQRYRHGRTEKIEDIENSIEMMRRAIRIAQSEDPNRAALLQNLAFALKHRYVAKGEAKDLQECIELAQLSVDLTPDGHPSRPVRLNNLGLWFYEKFLSTESMDDLDAAIRMSKEATNTAQFRDAARTNYFISLGRHLIHRYSISGAAVDRRGAIICFRFALYQEGGPTAMRIQAGANLVDYARDREEAFEAAKVALGLIPQLAIQSLQNSDKQHVARQVTGLASGAAATALQLSRHPGTALEFLETGRNLLAGSLEETRADVKSLIDKYPKQAERFVRLRDELEKPNHTGDSLGGDFSSSEQNQGNRIYETGKQFNEHVMEIRRLMGFETFLRPLMYSELQAAAINGPVVVINIEDYRCDALLVEMADVRSVRLEKLSLADIEDRVRRDDLKSPAVLEWLWDTVTEPILDALGFDQPPPTDDDWPHIWWVPTGLLSRFPLHAAGYHAKGSSRTVLDCVISSYSSSVKTLVRTRRRSVPLLSPTKALLVAMDHTPESLPLRFAFQEISLLRDLCADMKLNPVEPERKKQAVTSHLRDCKIFHFAGHGYTDPGDPAKSHLRLEDWKSDPLTVSDLLEMNLHEGSPFLAYLSACGTSRIHDEGYMDESIHLISACQLAGFRHVIGTLWEVNDESCVDIARIVYEEIRDGSMSDGSVAWGLHKAVRKLRDIWLDEPTKHRGDETQLRDARLIHVDGKEEDAGIRDCGQGALVPPRDVLMCEDDEDGEGVPRRGSLHWVPFVHFGV